MTPILRPVPDGRLASGRWVVNDLRDHGVELSWQEGGTGFDYCGWTKDMAAAEAFMLAVEAESMACGRDALVAAGFVREIPTGLHAGAIPHLFRCPGGTVSAWITYDFGASLIVAEADGSGRSHEFANAMLPVDAKGRPCSLTRGRKVEDLATAGLLAAWRSGPGR